MKANFLCSGGASSSPDAAIGVAAEDTAGVEKVQEEEGEEEEKHLGDAGPPAVDLAGQPLYICYLRKLLLTFTRGGTATKAGSQLCHPRMLSSVRSVVRNTSNIVTPGMFTLSTRITIIVNKGGK